MQKQDSTYHSLLRISAAVFACVLLFQSGLLTPYTAELANNAQLYVANTIGVTAGVEPTELNMYTAELTKREQELNAREAALVAAERELDTGLGGTIVERAESDIATFLLSVILFILLVLIILNYVLDYLRARERNAQATETTAHPA